jgi:hypothetical protein
MVTDMPCAVLFEPGRYGRVQTAANSNFGASVLQRHMDRFCAAVP